MVPISSEHTVGILHKSALSVLLPQGVPHFQGPGIVWDKEKCQGEVFGLGLGLPLASKQKIKS
jgi:hypothetical protein